MITSLKILPMLILVGCMHVPQADKSSLPEPEGRGIGNSPSRSLTIIRKNVVRNRIVVETYRNGRITSSGSGKYFGRSTIYDGLRFNTTR